MGMTGMDIEEVRQLAQRMDQNAGEIDQIKTQLTSQLDSTDWLGPDGDSFRQQWTSAHVTALTSVVNGLREASEAATRNANEQLETSSR